MMRSYEDICLGIPEILLPQAGLDLSRWAVIACDQFTSEPEYWQKVGEFVGRAPSTLNLIYPEVYLGEKNPEERIRRIRESMDRYIREGVFEEREGFVYVERQVARKTRKGILVCLDLEHYDYRKGATSLVRATEGTILERIPPRVRIREGAPIELPHIMVLIDDPENTVIGPLTTNKRKLEKLYDFELMMGSGRVAGYRVRPDGLENRIISSLKALAKPEAFAKKYGLKKGTPILLFAMGDGNHSLATAKAIWEKTKENASARNQIMDSRLRHAMVELVNLHDDALGFEPIHRVLFEIPAPRNLSEEIARFYAGKCRTESIKSLEEMKAAVDSQKGPGHKIGFITAQGFGLVEVEGSGSNLPVGTLQTFLDVFLKEKGAAGIDYVHGTEPVVSVGKKPGNMGFYLPAMRKQDLFKTVILDGALPRKTFSMGEAWEKRFYLEARRLT
jgi:uncharacterized protein (DUF1015 family)